VSLAAGWVLARTTPLDPPTAALGMIAGGASGIVGMSGELGADDRLVAFMQYLRVLVVVVLTPIGLAVLFGGGHEGGAATTVPSAGTLGHAWEWLLTAGLAAAGALGAARLRVTAGVLLGPMVLTAALVLSGAVSGFAVPSLLGQTAFSLIGLQIGLRFTTSTVRLLGRLTGPVVLSILGLLVACFGLAALLALTTPATLLDAYLATTPGGLYAVLAVAYGAGANTTFIVAVQSLRVIAMVLLAPLAVRRMLRPTAAGASAADPGGSARPPRPGEASPAPSGSGAGRRTRRGRSR
jgi:membrane AbrB-like protein